MHARIAFAAALAASTMVMPSVNAQPIEPSPTVLSGNITFDNFTCVSTGIPCEAINVEPYTSTVPPDPFPGEFGIRINGAFSALPGVHGDTALTYDAHIAGNVFTDASMYFNGTPISSISEQIYNLDTGNLIGQMLVTNPPEDFSEHIILSELATNIRVIKDIQYIGGDTQATISIIDQTYSQPLTPPPPPPIPVPEPASLALLGSALFGFGIIARRRRDI